MSFLTAPFFFGNASKPIFFSPCLELSLVGLLPFCFLFRSTHNRPVCVFLRSVSLFLQCLANPLLCPHFRSRQTLAFYLFLRVMALYIYTPLTSFLTSFIRNRCRITRISPPPPIFLTFSLFPSYNPSCFSPRVELSNFSFFSGTFRAFYAVQSPPPENMSLSDASSKKPFYPFQFPREIATPTWAGRGTLLFGSPIDRGLKKPFYLRRDW